LIHGFKNPIPPRVVKEGPCKEVILTGQDADLGRLPICTHNRKDAGPFITIRIGFVSHPDFGNNVSISRMQVLDTRTTGIRAMQQIGVYLADAEKHGQALEVAVTIGNDPYVTLCSQVRDSLWLDELGVAGGWMGEPVDLVCCETIGVPVPATSEIVLEGEIICGERAKLVIVVDDDIDVRNPEQVEWAIATRFQADRDLVVIPNKEGMFLDPSTPAEGVTAVMAMDATRPYGKDFAEVCDVPGTDTFVIPGWAEWEKKRKQLGAL
jgi:3-polyprenyl-4-hydroxybenzoate decarboxylase